MKALKLFPVFCCYGDQGRYCYAQARIQDKYWPAPCQGANEVDLDMEITVGMLIIKRVFHVCTAVGLAQSVERLTAEWEVAGLIPGAGPILRVLK